MTYRHGMISIDFDSVLQVPLFSKLWTWSRISSLSANQRARPEINKVPGLAESTGPVRGSRPGNTKRRTKLALMVLGRERPTRI